MRTLHYQGLIQQGLVNILYDTTDHFYGVNYLLQQEIIQRLHLLRIILYKKTEFDRICRQGMPT